MSFTRALYYPWIDIADESWLKCAAIYWDLIQTIVPELITRPYSGSVARELEDEGILLPLRVNSGMEEVADLTDDVFEYLDSEAGAELMLIDEQNQSRHIHMEKLSSDTLQASARIHPEKLSDQMRYAIDHSRSVGRNRGEWYEVDKRFAYFYMTLLATRLSDRIGAGPT